MGTDSDQSPASPRGGARFPTTHWSLVLAASQGGSPQAEQALAELCRDYWYPLYAFIRRKGHDPHTAQDLTQDFFASLLEKEWLRKVERAHGRFRNFLLSEATHLVGHHWEKVRAVKRGGRCTFYSLDETAAEGRYCAEPHDDWSPEKQLERHFALALLDKAILALQEEYRKIGKQLLFDELQPCLSGRGKSVSYSAVAARLGLNEVAVRQCVRRLRVRYGNLLREAVAETVADPADVEDELRHLLQVLAN